MLSLLRRRKLAQTQDEFDAQADAFLAENGFPVDDTYRKVYGSIIQMSPSWEDTFDPKQVAKMIRNRVAKELAFYLMQPGRREKEESDESKESGV